jgi:hypothetical protein
MYPDQDRRERFEGDRIKVIGYESVIKNESLAISKDVASFINNYV